MSRPFTLLDRRTTLGLLASSVATKARAGAAARKDRPRVCVIGAGVIGVSIAYHLAGRGADVVVLEQAAPGSGATQGAFAMLIATHDEDRDLNAFYEMAVLDWRLLERELDFAVKIQWGGAITWTEPGPKADALAASTRRLQGWGAPVSPISASGIEHLVPGVAIGPFGCGQFSPDQGALDPMQALSVLIEGCRRRGVRFRFPCAVRALSGDGTRVTAADTATGPVTADIFVLAAGAGTPALAAGRGVKTPIDIVSGTLAHSAPMPQELSRVLNGPAGSLKQDPDGRIVIGPDYRPGANGTDTSAAYGRTLLASAARVLPSLRGARLERMSLGFVPIPKDAHPIVGFSQQSPNLYVALTMSGVTLAPIIGRLSASEIADGIIAKSLQPFRPSRFT